MKEENKFRPFLNFARNKTGRDVHCDGDSHMTDIKPLGKSSQKSKLPRHVKRFVVRELKHAKTLTWLSLGGRNAFLQILTNKLGKTIWPQHCICIINIQNGCVFLYAKVSCREQLQEGKANPANAKAMAQSCFKPTVYLWAVDHYLKFSVTYSISSQ